VKTKRKAPEYVIRNGKPSAIILDIDDYRELLERLEDAEDLAILEDIRSKPMRFRKLDEFLQEYSPNV